MTLPRALLVGCLLLLITAPAAGETVYKCTSAGGAVSYQDAPCPRTQKQQPIHLLATLPAPPAAPPPEAAPEAAAPAPPPPAAPAPVAALPVMYSCQRATDGKVYLSRNGNPQPYLAPFGVLGAVQAPLASVYGPGGGGGASAPELNRGKVTSGLVANNYVWVQDVCRELGPEETCEALQDEYDDNEHKLKQAFKSERAPFEQRESELQAQLRNCRR
ncbi:MAG TPA: DUF4124 domain-containing protein [Dyella sp.]|nr:DUF4124 domain-containing protein [Dyella sp.]